MDTSDKKVLIVEDDDMLRNILVTQMRTRYLTLEAKDGEAALKQIVENTPDAVILDLMLPKTDGFHVLEALRANSDKKIAATPVVVVSNLTDPASIKKAESFNIEAYFTKADVSMGTLVNRIRRIFANLP